MSIPSLYASGDDEEVIFQLPNPRLHPYAATASQGHQETVMLNDTGYDDAQEAQDELDSRVQHAYRLLEQLHPEDKERVLAFLTEIQPPPPDHEE